MKARGQLIPQKSLLAGIVYRAIFYSVIIFLAMCGGQSVCYSHLNKISENLSLKVLQIACKWAIQNLQFLCNLL